MQHEMLAGYDTGVMGGQERFQGDSRLMVTFYKRPVHNPFKSAEEGRPIYDEHDFIKIRIPGDKYSTTDTKVTAEHQMRFPQQWARYLAGQEQAQSGTPLEVWPQATVGLVASLKVQGITTVEQLAELSDSNASQFMGNFDLRRRAQAFLEAAKGEAVNTKLEAALEKRDQEIVVLQQQVAELLKTAQKSAAKPSTKE